MIMFARRQRRPPLKLKSISRRTYHAILTVSLISMVAMVVTVFLVNEDLEDTMLKVEFAQERDFILMNKTSDEVLVWDTPNLAIVFVPAGKPKPAVMPEIFRGLPDSYSDEVHVGDRTYLINIEMLDRGELYIAKNITHFEDRESLFQLALAVMTAVIVGFSLLLALLSSRRIVMPLKRLSEQISRVPVGPSMPHIDVDYTDAELHSIALTFNRFLDELESYVRREHSLLSLASHELRTPIAVMSGAIDIIEMRGQLHANDQATLKRMRRACDEMRDNVEILLKLARREGNAAQPAQFALEPVARQVIEDLKVSHGAANRVSLESHGNPTAYADPVMMAMLLRNLVQNALQHTDKDISLELSPGLISIQDRGEGMTHAQQDVLRRNQSLPSDGAALGGLGLYIVTLMCERLHWKLEIVRSDNEGTLIHLRPV